MLYDTPGWSKREKQRSVSSVTDQSLYSTINTELCVIKTLHLQLEFISVLLYPPLLTIRKEVCYVFSYPGEGILSHIRKTYTNTLLRIKTSY